MLKQKIFTLGIYPNIQLSLKMSLWHWFAMKNFANDFEKQNKMKIGLDLGKMVVKVGAS